MTSLNLSESDQLLVRQILAAHAPQLEVWAYGSRVNGSGHDGSDLDLVVRDPSGGRIAGTKMMELREAFSESDLPILVDLLEWTTLPESFRNEIARMRVLIHSPHAPVAE